MSIIFKPEGFFKKEWDSENSIYIEKKIDKNNFFVYYRHELEIENDPTLLDFFETLYNLGPEVCGIISQISWCNLPDFIDEIRKDCDEKSTLDYLSVSKNVCVDRYSEDENAELEIYCELVGVGPADDGSGNIIDNWCVSFNPLYQMKDLTIKIKNTDDLIVNTSSKFPRNNSKNNPQKIESIDRVISLGEFVNAILYDVSFHGSPKERDNFSENISKQVDEIKNGTAQTVPFDDLLKRLEIK